MHPKLFTIPLPEFLSRLLGINSITVYTYAFCIVLGAVMASLLIKRMSQAAFNDLVLPNSFFYKIFLAGFVGGKLFCYLETPSFYINHPKQLLNIFSGGFVCYGSVIFIALFVIFYCRKHKINTYGLLDIIAIAAVIPQLLGRLGCFFAGCCYGKPTDSFLGVVFPNSAAVHVHPTQLYEAVLMSVVFISMLIINKYKKINGQVFLFYVFAYASVRFSLEFVRGDFRGSFFNGLISHSQTIAIATLCLASFLFFKLKKEYQPLN